MRSLDELYVRHLDLALVIDDAGTTAVLADRAPDGTKLLFIEIVQIVNCSGHGADCRCVSTKKACSRARTP